MKAAGWWLALAGTLVQAGHSLPGGSGLGIAGEARPEGQVDDGRRAAFEACHREFLGQLYAPDPNLWVIEQGDAAVYVLGTEHLLPTDFAWRSAAIDAAIARSSSLLTETGAEEGGPGAFAGGEREAPIVTGAPIATRLTGLRRAKWEGMAAVMPTAAVARINGLPSWMAAEAINLLTEQRFGVPAEWGPDKQLAALFKAAGKPVGAIETISVADYARVVDERAQRRMLAAAVNAAGTPGPWQSALNRYHAWARGGTDPLGLNETLRNPSSIATLIDSMATARNAVWADRIRAQLATGQVTFVAVGAAHLYGPSSLFRRLRAAGLRERLVSSPVPAPITLPLAYRPAGWADCSKYLLGGAALR